MEALSLRNESTVELWLCPPARTWLYTEEQGLSWVPLRSRRATRDEITEKQTQFQREALPLRPGNLPPWTLLSSASLPKQIREKASSQRDDYHAVHWAYSKITMQ